MLINVSNARPLRHVDGCSLRKVITWYLQASAMTGHCVMSVATDRCVTPINLHGNGSLRPVVKLMSICSINTHTRNSARVPIQIAMFLIIVRLLDLFCVADVVDGICPSACRPLMRPHVALGLGGPLLIALRLIHSPIRTVATSANSGLVRA